MGRKPRGVRLDSGDVVADSAWVRRRLDETGWADVEVFASGDLDEDRIVELLESGARMDSFGVGTALAPSADAPAIGVIYKLVELERGGAVHNAAKFSEAKVTYPGRKQVFRFADRAGKYTQDVIALEEERFPQAESLLREVMRDGKRSEPAAELTEARKRCLEGLERLPEGVRYAHLGRLAGTANRRASSYPVRHSARLEELFEQVRRRVERAARI